MPIYTVKDSDSGKTIKFNWNDANPPTDLDMEEIFRTARQAPAEISQPATQQKEFVSSNIVRPVVETAGLAGGGLIGSAAGPVGTVAGGALGYGIGKKVADLLDAALGSDLPSFTEGIKETPKLVATGAMLEMGGQVAGKALPMAVSQVGKVAGKALGKLTGTGEGAIQEAAKAGPEFTRALRGKVTGEEIVENAKSALQLVKDSRGELYRKQLAEIAKNKRPVDMTPIHRKLSSLMEQYNVQIAAEGKIDTSRIAMNKRGRRDVLGVIKTVAEWNREGDNTAVGLDTLKRQLDDFYSESSQARAFVQSLKDTVKKTITDAVPEYAQMTRGYAEATKLIKDFEAGLMLRKQGMTGRIVADQTLRRLMSAMRENSGLRKELLDLLGTTGSKELSQQVAGYTLRGVMPVGLAGTGPALIGQAALAKLVSPAFWPALMMSSPRVAGEFVQFLGRATAPTAGMAPVVGRVGAYETMTPKRKYWIPEPATNE